MTLQLRVAAHSEIGPVRKNNQDSGYASPRLLVVADGMGGAAAGDLASAVAIDTIREVDDADLSADDMLAALADAYHQANERIAQLVEADYALEGMGTTVTGVLFDGTQFGLAHIGDSRAYRLRDGHLERLTHDHSWVQSLVDDGKISEHEAAVHPHRSLLLKVLNGQPASHPDLSLVPAVVGDRLLLCSDGLCGLVDDPVIEAAMLRPDIDAALDRLVEEALAEGGVDNITVILADVVESGPPAQQAVLGAAAEVEIPSADAQPPRETEEMPGIEDERVEGAARTGPAAEDTSTRTGAGVDPGDDEARYGPQPPTKRRAIGPIIGLLSLILVVGIGVGVAFAWTRTQFYVGAADDRVAIFQGLSDHVPGVPLSRLYEVQTLAVSSLPPYYQDRVRASIAVANLPAAREAVGELAAAAQRCATQAPQPRTTPTTSPSTELSRPGTLTPPPPSVSGPTTPRAPVSAAPTGQPSSSASSAIDPNC